MHILGNFKPDGSWTLFLDRDGVINRKRENDYIKNWSEFEFIPGTLEAMNFFSTVFGQIFVVTNQQGIGRGLMTEHDLEAVHHEMMKHITEAGGRIDKIYFCPELATSKPHCRKPDIGMGIQALKDFPEIDLRRSIMVGDSEKDMEFASRLGMRKFFVNGKFDKFEGKITYPEITNLSSLASYIREYVQDS